MTLQKILKELDEKTKEEKIRTLRKKRAQLLEEIHAMQQLLDRLDYMIYEIKKQ